MNERDAEPPSGGGLDRTYPFRVRITVEGIDCYSVGAEGRGEAAAMKAALEQAEGVADAEVVDV